MGVDELKDYLSDKKNDVKNYIIDKKDSIKTNTKKAIATGLVVFTLFGGSIASTGCEEREKLPENVKEISRVINNVFDDITKERFDYEETPYKDKFSDLVICKDPVSEEYMMIFAGEKSKRDASYVITKEMFDKIYDLSIASNNENVEIKDDYIYMSKKALAEENMRNIADIVLFTVQFQNGSDYRIGEQWYTETWGWTEDILSESAIDEYFEGVLKEFTNNYPQLKGTAYDNFEIDEIRIQKTYPEDIFNATRREDGVLIMPNGTLFYGFEDIPYFAEISLVDYIDTDGDGVDDSEIHITNQIYNESPVYELIDEFPKILSVYDGDENIKQEGDVWKINPSVISNGKYVIFNELLNCFLNGTYEKWNYETQTEKEIRLLKEADFAKTFRYF